MAEELQDSKHALTSKTVGLSGAALITVLITVIQQYQSGGFGGVDPHLAAAVICSAGAIANRFLEKNNTKLHLYKKGVL